MIEFLIIAFGLMLVNLAIGLLLGLEIGRPIAGLVWAFLLGPIGWAIVSSLTDKRTRCRHCAEVVRPEALICPHCQRELFIRASAPSVDQVDEWTRSNSARQ